MNVFGWLGFVSFSLFVVYSVHQWPITELVHSQGALIKKQTLSNKTTGIKDLLKKTDQF